MRDDDEWPDSPTVRVTAMSARSESSTDAAPWCVPVVAEAGLGGSVVGIALQLFGNLNAKAPFAGVGVTVPVGWMP